MAVWPLTMIVAGGLGVTALIAAGRLLLLASYVVVSMFVFFLFLFLTAAPELLGPIGLLALNAGAVYAGRCFLLEERREEVTAEEWRP